MSSKFTVHFQFVTSYNHPPYPISQRAKYLAVNTRAKNEIVGKITDYHR